MFDDKKLIEAAKMLSSYCYSQCCTNCMFNFTNMACEGDGCMFSDDNEEDTFPYMRETHLIRKG